MKKGHSLQERVPLQLEARREYAREPGQDTTVCTADEVSDGHSNGTWVNENGSLNT